MSEYVPSPWEFTLLALAAFRIWKLLADDTILDRPRDWLTDKIVNPDGRPFRHGGEQRAHYWLTFLLCPWCSGAWICLLAWVAWLLAPTAALIGATFWALSAAVGLIGSVHETFVSVQDDSDK
jgi:hypothetical protein